MPKIDFRTHPAARGAVEELEKEFEPVLKSSGRFSIHVGRVFSNLARENLGDALAGITTAAQPIFQKWTLEMVYLLALSESVRFKDFKNGLKGISSRTLSLKLFQLERLGIVTRELHDERPVRVEYRLTDKGRHLAALTVPVVFYVYMQFPEAANLASERARPSKTDDAAIEGDAAGDPGPGPTPARRNSAIGDR